jgi:glycosyltransferase involved in cell wall biosynthesis
VFAPDTPRGPIRSVSVVIPVLNAAETLGEQLEALARQDFGGEWELVISDNGSTDESRRIVNEWADALPHLRVVDASDRRGEGHARNVGARAARGELVLVCDADDVVEPSWIAAMVRAAETADVLGGGFDESSLNDPVSRSWRRPHPDDGLPTAVNRFLPYAVSANCGVRSSVLRELGGWNEKYVWGGEDVELSWRAQVRGYRIAYVPDAVVRYRYRTGLRALARQFYHYGIAETRLYRDFRRFGARRRRPLSAAKWWAWLVVHLPDLARSPERKGKWVRSAAFHWGQLRGSIKYRTLYL